MVSKRFFKIIVFWFLALIPCVIALEVASFFFIINGVPSRIRARLERGTLAAHMANRQQTSFVQAQFIRCSAGPGNIEPMRDGRTVLFHPVLGWDYPPDLVYRDMDGVTYNHEPDGSRKCCTSFASSPIITYGDSFTYCSNVPDDGTWQTFLGRKLGVNVLNFGVGGYGTDQAYLKYRLYNQGGAKIVILGIFPENINRVVNIYRPFYNHDEPWGLTKPMFVRQGNEFQLIANPLNSIPEIAKINDSRFLERLGSLDYWFKLDQNLPSISCPYILSLYQWRHPIALQLIFSMNKLMRLSNEPRYPWNLYDEPEPFAIMCHIVDLFVATAKERNAIPLIVIMPYKDYVAETMENGTHRAQRLIKHLQKRGYLFIDVIHEMSKMKPHRSELETWFAGHATVEGNRIIADIIFQNVIPDFADIIYSEPYVPSGDGIKKKIDDKMPALEIATTK